VQSRQKSYANHRRRDLSFEVGDFVYLKVSPNRPARTTIFALTGANPAWDSVSGIVTNLNPPSSKNLPNKADLEFDLYIEIVGPRLLY
jgi:hypothetical protein